MESIINIHPEHSVNMTIRPTRFTPEVLITAPRRSSATPNANGTYALYTVSSYSLESHKETNEIRFLNLKTGHSTLFSDDANNKEPTWLPGDQLIWLRRGANATEIWIGNACQGKAKDPYLVGAIPAPIFNLKVKILPDRSIAVVFSGKATPDGELHILPTEPKRGSTAREYETASVRFWDTYWTEFRNSIFYTTLQKSFDGKHYRLSTKGLVNALKGSGLESPFPDSASGEHREFDISTTGILFKALDPDVNQALHFSAALYHIPLSDFEENPAPKPKRIHIPSCSGSISSGVFSADGKAAALLIVERANDRYALNVIFVIGDLANHQNVFKLNVMSGNREPWDLSPESIKWCNNCTELYVTAEDKARTKLFKIPVEFSPEISSEYTMDAQATELTLDGAVCDFHPLTDALMEKRILVNKTTLVDHSIYSLLDSVSGASSVISSLSKNGVKLGLSTSQVSQFYYKGAQDHNVHAWIVKPSFFQPDKTYPLAILIHGGPRGSWADAWCTRWNPAVFAEQGYIVVCPNPTGSVGFGYEFSAAVKGEWGGKVYIDIVKCVEHIESNFSFVDMDRACCLGASYGGYMINWIAGQSLAKRFKTLVVHDGVWSLGAVYASDIAATARFDFCGQLWENPAQWEKHDPCRYARNWTTPMLVVHSSKDYRCNINQGLAAYNICQQRGIRCRFLNFPDEPHVVLGRENSLHWHRTVLGWINKFTGVQGGVFLEPPVSEPTKSAVESGD